MICTDGRQEVQAIIYGDDNEREVLEFIGSKGRKLEDCDNGILVYLQRKYRADLLFLYPGIVVVRGRHGIDIYSLAGFRAKFREIEQ